MGTFSAIRRSPDLGAAFSGSLFLKYVVFTRRLKNLDDHMPRRKNSGKRSVLEFPVPIKKYQENISITN
jgi:hypothetical protein